MEIHFSQNCESICTANQLTDFYMIWVSKQNIIGEYSMKERYLNKRKTKHVVISRYTVLLSRSSVRLVSS